MPTGPDNDLYQRARPLLQVNPQLGKNPLAAALGIHAPMARRLKERYRGEQEGHSRDPLYQKFLVLKTANPTWGSKRISRAMTISVDIAQLFLARHAGAITHIAAPSAEIKPQAHETEVPSSIGDPAKFANDPLYQKAKQILAAHPDMGKQRLADSLGVKTPTSRRLLERYRGETQGHSSNPDYQRVLQLKNQHPDWGAVKVSQALGLTLDHAKLHLARWVGVQSYLSKSPPPASAPEAEAPASGAELQVSGSDDNQAVSYRGSRIRTIEDLLVFSQTDTRIWEVEKHVINKWEVGAKDPVSGGILTEPLFQLKLWLRRKVAEQRLDALFLRLLEQFKQAAPRRPTASPVVGARGMLEISIMDLHLGKYCWAAETGRAYDPDIAEKLFWDALEDLLHKAAGCRPEKILFVVGNDFFNVDNLTKTTTAGTPQDEAMRWQESFLRGRKLMISAVERLQQVAPVHVLVVPGNHDTQRLWYLGDVLAAWFRNTGGVTIDHSCHPRKYFVYGQNLIGFCHGNAEKHDKLPMLMAVERATDWAATRFREWHLGHFHNKKTKVFVAHQDLHSVQVRILPSLCPPDAWHASMGYTSKLAAEAYFWDAAHGCVATFTHSPN